VKHRDIPREWTGSPRPSIRRQSLNDSGLSLRPAADEDRSWDPTPKKTPVTQVPDSLEPDDLFRFLDRSENPHEPILSSNEEFIAQKSPSASYASVVASPVKETPKSSSPAPPVRPSVRLTKVKKVVEQETGMKCIYVTGMPFLKFGELRKFLRDKKFTVDKLINLSFMGERVCEVLLPTDYLPAFEKLARSYFFKTNPHFDPMDPSDHSMDRTLVSYYLGLNSKGKHERFIERIARDVKSAKDAAVGKFYAVWARKLDSQEYFERCVMRSDSPEKNKVFFLQRLSLNARTKSRTKLRAPATYP
jgi:hypothetical protein